MNSRDLVSALESLRLPNDAFRHRQHVQATVYYLRTFGFPDAQERVLRVISRYAASLGHQQKFHVTLTRCWVRLVAAALDAEKSAQSFEEFLEHNPDLLDKTMPLRFYSRDALFHEDTRARWVEPDLQALPLCPPHAGVRPWD
jgi:hypothetical protein